MNLGSMLSIIQSNPDTPVLTNFHYESIDLQYTVETDLNEELPIAFRMGAIVILLR
jgi:hypothetical protein